MLTILLAIILLVSGSDAACADPISSLIVGAIGLTGTAATVGTAILDIGLSVGLSFAAKAITPKNKTASTRGQSLNLQIATNPYRKFPVGTVGTAGDLTYWQLSGDNNDVLEMVVALGDVPCGSLGSTVFIDSKQHTIDGSGHPDGTGLSTKMTFTFRNGDPGQAVPTNLKNDSDGRWTDNEVGNNVCYVVVRAIYDEKTFPSGIPQIVFTLNGAKLYDWRKDSTNGGSGSHRWADPTTWEFSDNPIVALYSVLRGIAPGGVPLIGMGVPAAALRLSDFTAAANACDETVALAAGGTEKRYRLSAVFDTSMTNRDIIETILASCAGQLIESCGIYRPMVGVAQSSVASITDSDLIVTQPFQSDAKRPRTELYNAVYGSYSDPDNGFNEAPLPNRTSSSDEAEDGGLRLPQTLDLACVTSRTQAQRIMEIARKRARRQLVVSLTLRACWFTLEPGDWITFNSDRRGYTDRVFEIQTIKVNSDLTSDVVLREVDAGIDDWTTSDELADTTATDLASAGPGLSTVTGISLIPILITGDGAEQRPGLQIQWDAINDPTVTGLLLEYRKLGDTVALQRTIFAPDSGTYSWLDGVQGELEYEARLQPITAPLRSVDWSSWVTVSDPVDPQVVNLSAMALAVPPDTITTAMLDAQSRFELSLTVAVDTIQGGYGDILNRLKAMRENLADAAISAAIAAQNANVGLRNEQRIRSDADLSLVEQITTLFANLASAGASITTLQQTVADLNSAFATQITNIQSSLGSNTAAIQQVQTSLNGVVTQWGVQINANGEVTGRVRLDGTGAESVFSILASAFKVSMLGTPGGNPVDVFTIANVNGSPKIAFSADMYADGSITARHLNVASISTLYISDPSNTYFWNFATGQDGRTDGTWLMDRKNKTWDIIF